MTDTIIILIILAAIIIAVLRAKQHFRGGCCAGGSNTIREKKVLTEPVIGQMHLHIEGMKCENCAIRVENALNRLDGVLCKVHLKKKTAAVSFTKAISVEALKAVVEKMGYKVTLIR